MPKGIYERTDQHLQVLAERLQNVSDEQRRANSPRGRNTRTGEASRGFFYNRHGYKILTSQQGHPLATTNHQVGEHRKVLYDKIGPGPHPCHWQCGKILDWLNPKNDKIFVDHVDGDVVNNLPVNLVPSCWLCNFRRGRAGDPSDWKADYVSSG